MTGFSVMDARAVSVIVRFAVSRWVRTRTTESRTAAPLILPSLCRQPPRIRANNGGLPRMRIRRRRACTNKCEPAELGFNRLVNERSVACTTVRRQSAEHSLPVINSRDLYTGNTLRPNQNHLIHHQ